MDSGALNAASDPISYTARIVAAKRAIEQYQNAPLFCDPYASALAGDEVQALLKRWQAIAAARGIPLQEVIAKRTRYIAVRTAFIDALIMSALTQAQCEQIVILGAGLDTRAYRFEWLPNTSVYEIDCPQILRYKAQALRHISPNCFYHAIAGDLADPGLGWTTSLKEARYQAEKPTVWVLEGVVMYLPETAAHRLLQTISQLSVAGSVLGMDGVKPGSVLAGQNAKKSNRGRVVRHWQFGCDEPVRLLEQYGWAAAVHEPQDIKKGYGRYPAFMPVGTETVDQDEGRGVWLVNAIKH